MKGQGGGGTAKGGGKNTTSGGTVKVETSKPRQTTAINDNIVVLRSALFEENGKDKDVTKDIAKSFMKFDRNGLDVSIEFATKLSKDDAKWAFDLVKETMEDKYEESGYGWDDEDKLRELTEKGTRFLVVREWPSAEGQTQGEPVGFVHFRFTVQGEVIDQMAGDPSLHIYDLQIEEHSQRKGLGRHLLLILELVARREKMKLLSLPVQLGDSETKEWITHVGKGWAIDESLASFGFDADVEGFNVYSKVLAELTKRAPTIAAAPVAVSAPVVAPAAAAAAAPVETVFKAPDAACAAPTTPATPATPATPSTSSSATSTSTSESAAEEVEGGWVCL